MSSTRGVRTLVGLALASSVILLGGCSSSGTITDTSGLSPADASAAAVGGDGGGTSAEDPGCQAAQTDESSALKAINVGDPNTARDGFKKLADTLHADAGKSKIPAAASAIKKLGDDYATMASDPNADDTAAGNDSEAVGKACE